ncbi:PREDICTED: LOW QUALITY PROTEIN: killin [Mandrillus leucophaeus]|uniref:LOW QUALITY PROTEIN: killin n=1 Tax=Mandrillus leucophaeus TaxID=9568 RepID=UPI0005F4F3C1|nr:PREDICTED: LOW QUALITY PROTEIN: killin [Mandrillus leucophaeus]
MDRPGPGSTRPGQTMHVRGYQVEWKVRNGRKLQPSEWAGQGDLGGFKRGWKDTRATVGTTFRRRSRVFLVGELSKFPLPSDSSGGEYSSSFARGVLAWCRLQNPSPSRAAAETGTRTSLPKERCRGWRLGSWLHKHPHPNTCPRLPACWLPPILTERGERVPKLVPFLACYPKSKPRTET